MATAIKVTFTTPTAARGARVKAFAIGAKMVTLGYDHDLGNFQNAEAALAAFLKENNWDATYELGALGDGDYVAVAIPSRFLKARDAVIGARRAISRGDMSGNPHSKQWVQEITDLTDGVSVRDSFSREYSEAVLREVN